MVVPYLLILMVYASGSDGGNAVATARFEDQAACVAAGENWIIASKRVGPSFKTVNYLCEPAWTKK